jgi:hypothetical protein
VHQGDTFVQKQAACAQNHRRIETTAFRHGEYLDSALAGDARQPTVRGRFERNDEHTMPERLLAGREINGYALAAAEMQCAEDMCNAEIRRQRPIPPIMVSGVRRITLSSVRRKVQKFSNWAT